MCIVAGFFFFQAEDGIRDLVRSRGLGDVYKRQADGVEPVPRDGLDDDGEVVVAEAPGDVGEVTAHELSLIHI